MPAAQVLVPARRLNELLFSSEAQDVFAPSDDASTPDPACSALAASAAGAWAPGSQLAEAAAAGFEPSVRLPAEASHEEVTAAVLAALDAFGLPQVPLAAGEEGAGDSDWEEGWEEPDGLDEE